MFIAATADEWRRDRGAIVAALLERADTVLPGLDLPPRMDTSWNLRGALAAAGNVALLFWLGLVALWRAFR